MAKKYIIYTGTVQATYRNGQAASGVSDMDKVEFKSSASSPGSLSIYIKVPLQIMQNLRYELFLVDDDLKENLSGIFSSTISHQKLCVGIYAETGNAVKNTIIVAITVHRKIFLFIKSPP